MVSAVLDTTMKRWITQGTLWTLSQVNWLRHNMYRLIFHSIVWCWQRLARIKTGLFVLDNPKRLTHHDIALIDLFCCGGRLQIFRCTSAYTQSKFYDSRFRKDTWLLCSFSFIKAATPTILRTPGDGQRCISSKIRISRVMKISRGNLCVTCGFYGGESPTLKDLSFNS